MQSSNLFKALALATQAAPIALDKKGRSDAPAFSLVTGNVDPLELRRIKTSSESKGGLTDNDYAMRILPCPWFDPPLPVPSQNLAFCSVDGDPHDAFYSGVFVNANNPPFEKLDPINDSWWLIPGNETFQVGQNSLIQVAKDRTTEIGGNLDTTIGENEDRRVEQDRSISVGENLKIKNDAGCLLEFKDTGEVRIGNKTGAHITITPKGAIVVQNALGQRWDLGGASGAEWTWDLLGSSGNIINASGLAIEGQQIATIGARDSDGDVIISRGW